LPPTTTLAHSVGFPSPCATLYYSQSILPIHPIVSDFHHGLLADHLKSADWAARRAEFVAKVSADVLAEVTAKLRPLLGL
jgi:hypothetical protein